VTSPSPERQLDDRLFVVCGLAWAAGVIHAKAAIDHRDVSALHVVFFEIVACAQLLWGAALYRRPGQRLLAAGAIGSLAVVAVWVLSRTIGLPVGPTPWRPEAVAAIDAIATADEIVLAGLVALGLGASRRPAAARWLGTPLVGVALALVLVSSLVVIGPHVH
jgi:hypothetical protein